MLGPEVMLASPGKESADRAVERLMGLGWRFEVKWDGIRAVVTRTRDGKLAITNRRRVDITKRYPDVVATLDPAISFAGQVDGEIIVASAAGQPDFRAVHQRDAQSSLAKIRRLAEQLPAQFIPFDLLEIGDADIRGLRYRERRDALFDAWPKELGLPPMDWAEGAAIWKFVTDHHLEGMIAKRPDSPYRPGRSPSWVKIKSTRTISALVTGIVPGQGSRNGRIGALELALTDRASGTLVPIGSVGSGMSEAALATLAAKWDRSRSSGIPLVVDVEYLEVAASGSLRFPVYRGVREDVDPDSCVIDALYV